MNTNDKIMLNVTIALLITIGHSGCSIVPLTLGKVDSTKSSILYANQRIADSLKGLHTATQEECEAAQIANAEESSRQEERRVAHLHALRSERYRARDELQESVKETLRSDLNLAMYQQLQLGEMTVDADEVSRIALQRKDDLATRRKQWAEIEKIREEVYNKEVKRQMSQLKEAYSAGTTADCGRIKVPCPPKIEPYKSLPEPQLQPLRMAEIPVTMKLRVNLGVGSPSLRTANILRTEPVRECPQPCQTECESCAPGSCVHSAPSGNAQVEAYAAPPPPAPGAEAPDVDEEGIDPDLTDVFR